MNLKFSFVVLSRSLTKLLPSSHPSSISQAGTGRHLSPYVSYQETVFVSQLVSQVPPGTHYLDKDDKSIWRAIELSTLY